MDLPNYFSKFLKNVRLTDKQRQDCQTGHTTLRNRLKDYDDLKDIIVDTFLQGSYRRTTAIRPHGDKRSDVDIVVVTRLDKEKYKDPNKAMDIFDPFLARYYENKYKRNGRSFSIELSYVDLDFVITSAPSEAEEKILKSAAVTTLATLEEATDWRLVKSWVDVSKRDDINSNALMEMARKEEEWKSEPLWIPDRDAGEWQRTNPLEQIKWTQGKNTRCNTHFVNVVKAIKWWQRINHKDDRPKGYPLEHIIGDCCPDWISNVAEGITETLKTIVDSYGHYVDNLTVPFLPDRGLPEQNVFARITGQQFSAFYKHAKAAAKVAREALDSNSVKESADKWRELLGDQFPPSDDDDEGNKSAKGPFVTSSLISQAGDHTPRKYG